MFKFSLIPSVFSFLVLMWLLFGSFGSAFFQQNKLFSLTQTSFPFPITEPIADTTTGLITCPYDIVSDTSFQKYLSDTTPFFQKYYVPDDLLPIQSDFTANNSRKYQLREEAGIQFADLAWHFWNYFSGDRLVITSAYRSASVQNYLLRSFCKKDQCALPGTSEHQAWLAVDIAIRSKKGSSTVLKAGNKYYDWLVLHAHEFGFHNTYQNWVAIDGKMIEPRHRRYVWIWLATLLYEHQQSFAERMNSGSNQIYCPTLEELLVK